MIFTPIVSTNPIFNDYNLRSGKASTPKIESLQGCEFCVICYIA